MAVHKLPSPIPAPYAIERGVPVPAQWGRSNSYPFSRMEVGDSFYVAAALEAENVRMASRKHGERHGQRYTTRKVANGHRCWRIA